MSSTNQGATAPTPDQLVVYEAWLRAIANGTCDFDSDALTESSEAIEALRTRVFNLEAQVACLTEALTDIAVYGCGMLSQPAELNGRNEAWLEQRIAEYERRARTALKEAGADE